MNNQDTRFANQYAIQWFPGHMAKTLRMMEQEIQHVDASLVLLDARIPLSSLNPEIERITARKPKLYALNKADLADPAVTEEWIRYFHEADAGCVAISAKQKGGANAVKAAIEKELSGLLARRQNRGITSGSLRSVIGAGFGSLCCSFISFRLGRVHRLPSRHHKIQLDKTAFMRASIASDFTAVYPAAVFRSTRKSLYSKRAPLSYSLLRCQTVQRPLRWSQSTVLPEPPDSLHLPIR